MSSVRSVLVGGALAVWAMGCGTAVYQPSKTTNFELDSAQEINDDDVRKAFEARPQMREKVQIAFYSFEASKADEIEAMLKGLPGVSGTYRIPSLLATGQRRFEERRSWDPPVQFSMKKLRLMAARAHCDLLVVFDYGHRVETSANGWVVLDILLLPTLFVPFLDVKVTSAMDAFVMDTRNGYLYAHVDAQKEGKEDYDTIYSADGDRLIKAQWPQVLNQTAAALRKTLETERAQRAATPVQKVEPTPAPSAAPPAPNGSAEAPVIKPW